MSGIDNRPKYLPLLVWGVAGLFYVIAVMNRTSLAALGPTAQEHFSIQATALSSFAVLQLIMYAGMQIPVGTLLDRFGVTWVLVFGGTIMLLGQVIIAYTSQVWVAVLARMMLGVGDAGIFISVMRLLPDWFEVRRLPLMGQLTALLGNLGQIASLVPLVMAVSIFGWSGAFVGVAAAGLLVVLLGVFVLRDTPGGMTVYERLRGRAGRLTKRSELLVTEGSLGADLLPDVTSAIGTIVTDTGPGIFSRIRTLLKLPGIRLAFWIHLTAGYTAHVILLLWGTPFLMGGIGMNAQEASTVLSATVLVSVASGLGFGKITAKYTSLRVYFVLATLIIIIVLWSGVIFWPGQPPLGLVFGSMFMTVVGGTASMISFEVVRSYSPRRMAGVASGLVNMGAFIGGLFTIFAIGITLDLLGAGTPSTYSLEAFQTAFQVFYVVWGVGLSFLMIELRKTKRWLRSHS